MRNVVHWGCIIPTNTKQRVDDGIRCNYADTTATLDFRLIHTSDLKK